MLTTFAKKIEFQLSNFFLNFKKTLDEAEFGKVEAAEKISLFRKYNFTSNSKKIVLSGFVDVGGILVKRDCVVQTGVEIDDTPLFGLVSDVIVEDESKIMLGCQKIINLGFHQNMHAYSVCLEKDFFICKFSKDYLQKVSYIFDAGDKKYV